MFHAEYSSGSPLRMLVDLRNVMDAALARTSKKAPTQTAPKPPNGRAKAAAAGAQLTAANTDTNEFEVNSVPQWDEDSSGAQADSDNDDKV